MTPPIIRVPPERINEVVEVLCDSFHDYPVMRYALEDAGADYDHQLRALIHVFVSGRTLRGDPILGVEDNGRLVGVATITPPGDRPPPPEFTALRDSMWELLGAPARARYEALIAVWERSSVPGLHHHINMIGIAHSHHGRGLARPLLEAVHAMAEEDPQSIGVTLSTELTKNVTLYQHFGYEVKAHARVSDSLETWSFYRPKRAAVPTPPGPAPSAA
jgi:GNAT superfamily N-acetyltransferase